MTKGQDRRAALFMEMTRGISAISVARALREQVRGIDFNGISKKGMSNHFATWFLSLKKEQTEVNLTRLQLRAKLFDDQKKQAATERADRKKLQRFFRS